MKQKFVLLFLFVFFWKFNDDVFVTHTGHLSAGLPYWLGRTFMPANVPPYHTSSCSLSGSWVRCVISSVTKGVSCFYRKLTSLKSEVEILACVLVFSSPEFQHLFIFSPIACPVDIKLYVKYKHSAFRDDCVNTKSLNTFLYITSSCSFVITSKSWPIQYSPMTLSHSSLLQQNF